MADSPELVFYREDLNKAIAAARRGEGQLAEIYAEVSEDIRARVRHLGDSVLESELVDAIDQAFRRTVLKRVRVISEVIEEGARLGPQTVRRTMREVFGDEVRRAQVRASKSALREAADRISGRSTVDGVALSKRIRKWDADIGARMAQEIQSGMRAKRGILDIADNIRKLDSGLEVKLPRYIQELEAAARGGNTKRLKQLVKRYTHFARTQLGEMHPGNVRQASQVSIRSATQRFVRAIGKAAPDDIDDLVREWVEHKALYHARVIARHENVEAFRRSYREQARNKPGVVGMRWLLSPRHPVPDECDIFAAQNKYDLGPGGYPLDKLPRTHPMCICNQVVIIDRHHFKRRPGAAAVPQEFIDKESPDAIGWMIDNEGIAQKILGPTRWAAFKDGVPVLDADGRPRLVRDVLADWGKVAAE